MNAMETFYLHDGSGPVLVREGAIKRPLDLPRNLGKHWPTEIQSAARLSLALLADALHNNDRALRLHERFNWRVVSILPDKWILTRSRIVAYANTIEMDERASPGGDRPVEDQ
jgi:hypothetical protein